MATQCVTSTPKTTRLFAVFFGDGDTLSGRTAEDLTQTAADSKAVTNDVAALTFSHRG